MARHCRYTLPCDTSLFTPQQLQPVMAGRIANTAMARWLHDHLVSYRRLLTEYRTGLVVWSVGIRYEHPLRFDDADTLLITAEGRTRHGGRQMEWTTRIGIHSDARHIPDAAVRVHLVALPVRLDGDAALSARPAPLPPELLRRFPVEEDPDTPCLSPVPALRHDLERTEPPLARSRTPFLIHRAACEMADQWAWTELVALAAAGRERLVLDHAAGTPRLRAALQQPLRRLDARLTSPAALFDAVEVDSRAWPGTPHPAFTHTVRCRGRDLARVVEQW
ncbi:hypothetical protein [Streptomyces noursei]|uniref:hypothetical protein n=1 Tax=Streptomyces noursei TaxID=1971 RepID=UPI00167B0709|nr:hypothetical protein [Streptomyces noursei]MCZ1020748.1 hypothetical protein [Streptomyces noursei]GGX28547.1 hypothetical protein GCM10010341_57500 [Streptomyces noursei]